MARFHYTFKEAAQKLAGHTDNKSDDGGIGWLMEALHHGKVEAWLRDSDGRRINVPAEAWIIDPNRPWHIEYEESTGSDIFYWLLDISSGTGIIPQETELTDILIDREQVNALCRKSAERQKNKGGAPTKWDWTGAMIWLGAYIYHKGLPETQASLVDSLRGYFVETADDAPDQRQLKTYVRKFLSQIQNFEDNS